MRHPSLAIVLPALVLATPALAKLVPPPSAPAPAEAAAPADADRVEVAVAGVVRSDGGPVVLLREPKTDRLMPIWIGPAEARAIQRKLDGDRFPRPLTHDLLASTIERLGARLEAVEVSDLRHNTFIGTALLRTASGERIAVDARPSDLIALALRVEAPIFVRRAVLEAGQMDTPPELRATMFGP